MPQAVCTSFYTGWERFVLVCAGLYWLGSKELYRCVLHPSSVYLYSNGPTYVWLFTWIPQLSSIVSLLIYFIHITHVQYHTYNLHTPTHTCTHADGLVVCHLPYGPTASFTLSNTIMRHDIPDVGTMSEAFPHLVFHQFTSKLGKRVS